MSDEIVVPDPSTTRSRLRVPTRRARQMLLRPPSAPARFPLYSARRETRPARRASVRLGGHARCGRLASAQFA